MAYDTQTYNNLADEVTSLNTMTDGLGESIQLSSEQIRSINAIFNPDVAKQEELYKKRIDELNQQIQKQDRLLMKMYSEKTDAENKVDELQQRFAKLEQNKMPSDSHFNYFLDTRLFADSDDLWVQKLCDFLFIIAKEQTESREYLLKNASYIVAVYHTLSDGSIVKHRLKDTRANFVYFWNKNIANRIEDPKRRKQLTCKEKSFNSLFHKDPWNCNKPKSWYGKANIATAHNETLYAMDKIYRYIAGNKVISI